MTALFDFLKQSNEFPKIYWKSRGSSQAFAGYGSTKKGPVSFGGHAFTPKACQGIWSSFPASLFLTPAAMKEEAWEPSKPPLTFPQLIHRKDAPSFDKWWMMVGDAVEKIEKGQFKKVVLARQTTLTFDGKVDPLQVLRLLQPMGLQTSLFLLQLDADTSFIGATPEKLFHRQDRKISTEALAGTKDQHEEWTPKEYAEVEAVQLFLHEKLIRCCTDIQFLPPRQKSFGSIKHLYQGIEGVLKKEIADEELFFHLHPTPALGGYPQQEAVDYLTHVEPFDRGWYGGLFGRVSSAETDMAVAIRCALIRGNEMHLFAGAGIVKNSKPDKEWEELDRKIAHFIKGLST